MTHTSRIVAFTFLFLSIPIALAQVHKPAERASSQVIDFWVGQEEQKIIAVADAMPADKYPFAPTDGDFKGVRTFAQQIKHLAATNFLLGAAILDEAPPADAGDETGPESLRTKADVIRYLKDSFAYLHRAAAAIDDSNAVMTSAPISPMPKGTATRLGFAVEALLHSFDHYGQLVEYLRMNNIVPPASRLDAGRTSGGSPQ